MENYFLILEEDDTDEYCNSRLCTLQDFDPTKLHNAEFWSPYENYQTLKACIFFTFLLLYLRYLRNKNIRFTSNIFILIILCSFLDWLQAYFILLYFALLCFIYVAIFTNWRFVAIHSAMNNERAALCAEKVVSQSGIYFWWRCWEDCWNDNKD